jgi:hypothetical protein
VSVPRVATLAFGAALSLFLAHDAATVGFGSTPAESQPTESQPAETQPVFAEVDWPFLLDQWGRGRAFRCSAGDCGVAVNVYVRAKIGFCNCATGVSDDAELDRVGDISLISDKFVGLRAGEPVTVGWMSGRARLYDAKPNYAPEQNALAVAVNDKCDVIVATVTAGRDLPPVAERAALAFLRDDQVLRWARAELGL